MTTNGNDTPDQAQPPEPRTSPPPNGLFGIPTKWLLIGGGGAGGVLVVVIVVVLLLLVLRGGGSDLKADYIDTCSDQGRRGWNIDEDVCMCGWAILERDFESDTLEEIEDIRRGDVDLEYLFRRSANYCSATQDVKRSLRPDIGDQRRAGNLDIDIIEDYLEDWCEPHGIDPDSCQCALNLVGGDFDDDTFEELEDEDEAITLLMGSLAYCAATDELPRRLRPDR